ncbi:MAG: acyltransferase family protein [Akkermansia sp.]|nr:acyltransferase family protein [Akkermansia sp.]
MASGNGKILHLAGIRGFAIILVLLFHLNPAVAPQGYYGVDMFFVLSGYFLIGRQLQDGSTFSLSQFVSKRFCRLVPPLIATVLTITLLCTLILPAQEACAAAMTGRSALLSWLNVYLADATSSYFAENTRTMPLMHLWYMSVLLQCYAFYAVLFFLWEKLKCGKGVKMACLGVVAFLSLCIQFRWCVAVLGGDSSYASSTYFWSSTRLYEFALGGFAYLVPVGAAKGRFAPWLASVALLILTAACFVPIPGGERWTPAAVLLTLCIVVCGKNGFAGGVLGNKIVLYIGAISFSLYLVHWPVICFAEYMFNTTVSGMDVLYVLILVFLLSLGLYYAVEKRQWRVPATLAAWLAVVAFCSIVPRFYKDLQNLHPLPNRSAESHGGTSVLADVNQGLLGGTETFEVNTWGKKRTCQQPILIPLGKVDEQASFVLLGDSHAARFSEGFSFVGEKEGWSGVYLNSYFHPFWNSVYRSSAAPNHNSSEAKAQAFLHWLAIHPEIKVVFIAQWWQRHMVRHDQWDGNVVAEADALDARIQEMRAMCQKIRAVGKQPVIIADTPTIQCKNPQRVYERLLMYGDFLCRGKQNMEASYDSFMRETAQAQAMFKALEDDGTCVVLHVENGLFHDGMFRAVTNGKLLMSDDNHLSPEGSVEAVGSVSEEISRLLHQKE